MHTWTLASAVGGRNRKKPCEGCWLLAQLQVQRETLFQGSEEENGIFGQWMSSSDLHTHVHILTTYMYAHTLYTCGDT